MFLDLSIENAGLVVATFVVMMYLLLKPAKVEKYMDNNRRT